MKQLIITLGFLGFTACARLDNQYLPVPSANSKQAKLRPKYPSAKLLPNTIQQPTGLHPSEKKQLPLVNRKGQGPPPKRLHPRLTSTTQVPILKYDSFNAGDGNYHYAFEAGNGIKFEEQRHVDNGESEDELRPVVRGSYSYPSPDGKPIVLHYIADENGFQPSGDHLPTPPPVPTEIQRSIERNQVEQFSTPLDSERLQESGPY